MIAVELAGVSKRYGAQPALDGLDLVVPSGRVVGLLGPNGAGKSTALRIVLGLVRPGRGHARLRGRDPLDPEARRGVGYLPERLALPPEVAVRRLLHLHGALAGLRGAALDEAIERTAEETGVIERLREPAGSLSKGLAQRLGFALALLGEPDLLILDEPTSGLDPLGVRAARDWIRGARARGATVLVSSHSLSEVERCCEEVAILRDGRLVAAGPLETLVRPGESLEDAFVRAVEA